MLDIDLRTVKLSFPKDKDRNISRTDGNTWITMLEQLLSCDYDDYTVSVETDQYHRRTNIEIIFATVDDATWFRLRRTE